MIVEHSAYYFYFNDPATTEIYTLSLHDALPISVSRSRPEPALLAAARPGRRRLFIICGYLTGRSEEHTSELQSRRDLVCRLLLEKKKKNKKRIIILFILKMNNLAHTHTCWT